MEDIPGFNIKYDCHQKVLIESFFNLKESDTLVDCVLEVEGRHLNAHKVILSACSIYFSDLFKQHQGTIFKLSGVSFQELEIGVEFIYKGEINIPQDQLKEFFNVIKTLQIKGLFEKKSSYAENNNCVSHHNLQEEQTKLVTFRQESQCSVSRNRKVGRIGDLDFTEVQQEEHVIHSLEATHAADDKSYQSETLLSQGNSKSLGKKERTKKTVILRKKSSAYFTALNCRGLKKSGIFSCPQCGNIYKRNSTLLRHLTYECGKEPKFQCDICKKKSKHKADLLKHMKIHNPVGQTYSCPQYGKAHKLLKIHDQERKMSYCPQCGKGYKQNYSLNRHLKYECGIEPQFQCNICKKKIRNKSNLIAHLKLHDQERKTYYCPQCGKAYKQLKKHLKYVYGIKTLTPSATFVKEK